jgi:hypothetical protein
MAKTDVAASAARGRLAKEMASQWLRNVVRTQLKPIEMMFGSVSSVSGRVPLAVHKRSTDTPIT